MSAGPIFILNTQISNAVSLGSSFNSSTVDISEVIGYAVQLTYTGTPTGSLTINASNDGTNFFTVATVTLTGSAGTNVQNFTQAHYKYVRISYTFTSGAGTLTAYVSGKRS